MADNTINVKIREAYDTEANWTQKNPKLLQGQIAISSDKHGMYKVGDGTKTWSQLSYASHPASDVYAWAKAQTKPSYSASEITGSVTGVKGSSETSYRTGDVNITKAHIGLSNVDNTSDANKPISTATQTALDGKQATITGGATTIVSSNLTANRALISNSSGKVAVSDVTSTELGYLDGVTSSIQTQLDGKASSTHNHDQTYLKLSGGTMSGKITLKKDQLSDSFSGNGGLDANNSDIHGVNSIYFADAADATSEGLQFYRDATHADSLRAYNGKVFFTPNRTLGASGTSYEMLVLNPNDTDKVPDQLLTWGSKIFSGSFSYGDTLINTDLSANRFSGLKAAGITIEYSRDSGATWTDYGTNDLYKRYLFTEASATYPGFIVGGTSGDTTTAGQCQLRVTIDTSAAGIYTHLRKIHIYISTNYSNGSTVTIKCAQQSAPNNYSLTICENQPIAGWSGWNVIPCSFITYGNTASQYQKIQFTFKTNGVNQDYVGKGLTVSRIRGYGGVGWSTPSTMALNGKAYQYKFVDGHSNPNLYIPTAIESPNYIGKVNGYTIGDNVPANAKFTDTTYTFAPGDNNGQIKVTPSGGTAQNVSVKGLGSNAYTSTTFAPLDSPNLTGTPKAPTATAGTNQTQIATTAFVKTAVDNLINGAPEAYDTLREISDYISSHNSEYEALLAISGDKANASEAGAQLNLNATKLSLLNKAGTSLSEVTLGKANVGLGNVENKSSATIRGEITQSNVTTALGFTPAKNSDLALKQDIRIDGSAYNPNAAGYVGGSGAKKYARILIPNQQNIWSMIWMELSVRYNYSAQNGAYHGKVFVSLHHNNVSPYTWQNLHAVAVGHHDPNMAVYASDGKYVYVLMNTAYQTISVDKILVGDSARNVDLSNITVDFVDELPSTHQTAVMLFTENPPKVNGFTVQQNVPENAKFTDTTYTFGTGDANGQIKVTPSGGTAQNISVKGLGSLAYLSSLNASDVGAATSDHTHSVATSSANGFMSSSDKSRLDSLDKIITLPEISYEELPSQSTNSNIYFKEWLAYIVANYKSIVRSGKVIVTQVRPNSQGTAIGWCYTGDQVDSETGLPRYCCFIYIPLGNSSPIKFGCNNYTYYYSSIDTTYTAANAAPGKIATSSSTGTSSNYARQDHTHGIDLATGDANGQVKIAGTNVSVKGLGSNAYTSTTFAPLNSPALTGVPTAPTAATGTITTQIATTAFVNNQVNDLKISGRNLLKNSHKAVSNGDYLTASYYFGNDAPAEGEIVTLQIKGQLASTKSYWLPYNSGASVHIPGLTIRQSNYNTDTGIYTVTGAWVVNNAANTHINIYAVSSSQSGVSQIEWIKLERGSKATDWSPAPEDVVTSLSIDGKTIAYKNYTGSSLGTITTQDTTYTFATGDSNGQIKVTPTGGTAQNVSVKGLAALAYKDSLSKSDVGLGNVDNKSSATIRGEITSQNVTTALGYTPVNKAGDTMTGSLTATSFQTGDNDNNFFQTRRFRGEGNANTYYHAIDFGYAHHDQVDFYEYGGVFNFHKHTGQAIDVGDTIIGTINSDGWNGGAVLTGAPTAPTATAGTNTTQIATTEFVKTAVDNFAASGAINKATTLETPRTIDGVAFNGSANVTHFGVCSTNAETAEKAVACNNFSLDTGQVITVKFTTTNTAQTDITLNVNSTGAKAVKYRNSVASSSSLFVAGRTYQFVYDGEAYQLVGDIDSNIDSKVMQSLSTGDVDHPVLFSYTNKNDTTADINNGSYRSNSIYANPQTGTLTATTLKGYLDGNAKSATASSFLNPTDSNTTYGSSTERGTITDGVVVFGESFRNTVDFVNEDESMISDSGDITMWMKQEADDDVRLNMSIDGDYYAHKDQVIAKLSEVVTLNGDQTVLGYKTFPGATFTNDTRWETGDYGFMIRNDGESTWFLLTAQGDPTGSYETPHPIRIKHDNHEVYFGSPVTAQQGITGSLTGHASLDVPISTGFGQNLSGYASSDDNTISGTVVRYSSGQATGKPTGTDHALFQMAYSDSWKTQLAQDWRTNKAYIRSCNNGTWGDWAELYKIGDQLSSDLLFANSGTSTRQIRGIVGDNDYWRIAGGATASNAGWMEVATADDGNEPIYARQYTGAYTAIKRTATILDANGNTSFPNRLYVGTEQDTQEQQIVCRSSAGTMYLYSQNGQGNNRGLYCPAHGSGSAIGVLTINTNNQPTYSGYLNKETYQPTTGAAWNIPFCARYNRNEISVNDSLRYHFRAGSSQSQTGYAIIQIGNGTDQASANGTCGRIRMFGQGAAFHDIYTNTSANRNIFFPNRGGTIFTTEMFSLSGTTLTISTS